MSGRLGNEDGIAGMVDSLTSVPDGGNSGMEGIAAARGRGETSAEDEPAAVAGVIPLQEESKRATEVCALAALTSIPNKPDMY